MNKGLLPVGTLVKLRMSKEKYCIIGFGVNDKNTGRIYDYAAVTYPIGLQSLDDTVAFDEGMIKRVIHIGYVTPEDMEYRQNVVDAINNFRNGTKVEEKSE